MMESFEFKSIEYSDLFTRSNRNLVEFSIQLQWQTTSPVYKVPKKFHRILAHEIHQALTEFFLRHSESECLWLLNSPETGKKVFLEKIHQPKPKERKLFENYSRGVCKIFIMINSLSLSKLYKHR